MIENVISKLAQEEKKTKRSGLLKFVMEANAYAYEYGLNDFMYKINQIIAGSKTITCEKRTIQGTFADGQSNDICKYKLSNRDEDEEDDFGSLF
mgnify:CR=1 FL=1